MDRPKAKELRLALDAVFSGNTELFDSYDCSVKLGNAKFDSNQVTFKVILTDKANGKVVDVYAENFRRYAGLHGFEASDLNKEFEHGGTRYRLSGLNLSRRKKKILIRRLSDDKEFIASPRMILPLIGKMANIHSTFLD
jgi:hypothetical protein